MDGEPIEIAELNEILGRIVKRVETIIKEGRRDEILNERFFHHIFSHEICSFYQKRGVDMWENLILIPEAPTPSKFYWEGVDMESVEKTRINTIGKGKAGDFDFKIINSKQIFVEWKGPETYTSKDILKMMLKLFTETDGKSTKVFCAIITRAKKAGTHHRQELENRVLKGLNLARQVLNLKKQDLSNLHVYVITIPDSGCRRIFWDYDWDVKYSNYLDNSGEYLP